MIEILWVIGRAMCPRMRVEMALSIDKETYVSFCDVQQKLFFGSAILLLFFVTSAKQEFCNAGPSLILQASPVA
jgi:hypothetical protein